MSSGDHARRVPLLTVALALAAVASASAQGTRPRGDLKPCWHCVPAQMDEGFRCEAGAPEGGTSCSEAIVGNKWVCETHGFCSVGLQGDSLDISVVVEGESVELASRVGPGTFISGSCSHRRLHLVDADGLVLGSILVPDGGGATPASKSPRR